MHREDLRSENDDPTHNPKSPRAFCTRFHRCWGQGRLRAGGVSGPGPATSAVFPRPSSFAGPLSDPHCPRRRRRRGRRARLASLFQKKKRPKKTSIPPLMAPGVGWLRPVPTSSGSLTASVTLRRPGRRGRAPPPHPWSLWTPPALRRRSPPLPPSGVASSPAPALRDAPRRPGARRPRPDPAARHWGAARAPGTATRRRGAQPLTLRGAVPPRPPPPAAVPRPRAPPLSAVDRVAGQQAALRGAPTTPATSHARSQLGPARTSSSTLHPRPGPWRERPQAPRRGRLARLGPSGFGRDPTSFQPRAATPCSSRPCTPSSPTG